MGSTIQPTRGKIDHCSPNFWWNVHSKSTPRPSFLVGGWTNPFEKNMLVKTGIISPKFGVNIKNMWVATTSFLWHLHDVPHFFTLHAFLFVAIHFGGAPERGKEGQMMSILNMLNRSWNFLENKQKNHRASSETKNMSQTLIVILDFAGVFVHPQPWVSYKSSKHLRHTLCWTINGPSPAFGQKPKLHLFTPLIIMIYTHVKC